MRRENQDKLSKTAASGLVALVFLVLGFQLAIFVVKVVERSPVGVGDDVAVGAEDVKVAEAADGPLPSEHFSASEVKARSREASPQRSRYGGYERPSVAAARTYESFVFDPNTVSLEDLQRLGLSPRQAESIENYRSKGGRFRTKADFQKMYVVSDTLFARLESFIEIPKMELNAADSASLVALRGIGPWYARKILDYRQRLGGFFDKTQLLEIDGIDAERFAGLADEVSVDPTRIRRLDIWHAPDSLLARHPYIGARGARSLVRYRELYDSTRWTLPDLAREQVLSQENIEKLKKYIEIQ
ncbi:MAG: helix-hairpin-helix domain-containing protein [Bacteroidales bacterium]|nr:helix-hairpin-helix domain-containing protein [Bacteroidales bacterium]